MNREDEIDGRIRGLYRSMRDAEQDTRFLAVVVPLSVALLALTATDWLIRVEGSVRGVVPTTAWDLLAATGWTGAVALVLVLATGVGGLVSGGSGQPGARVHLTLAAVAGLTVLWGFLVVVTLDDDYHTAPGLWMGMLAAGGLTVAHGVRAGTVSRRTR